MIWLDEVTRLSNSQWSRVRASACKKEETMLSPDAESMLLMAARLRQAHGLTEVDNETMRDAAGMLDQAAKAPRPISDERAVSLAVSLAIGKQTVIDGAAEIIQYATDAVRSSFADYPAKPARLDAWIESEFSGHGLAMRKIDDPPIPGEPLMSMAEAKELTRRAVATFGRSPAAAPSPVRTPDEEQAAFQTDLLFLFTPWVK